MEEGAVNVADVGGNIVDVLSTLIYEHPQSNTW